MDPVNIVAVHKNNDKQLVKNYRPISLLPACDKFFEPILYYSLFNFLNQNDLISPALSGFKPGDSCINQLLSVTHEIYYSIDEGYEIRDVILDIWKAFDKVWHEGLVFKLKQKGIRCNLLNILDFLRNRKQRVVLNGQASLQVFPKVLSRDRCCSQFISMIQQNLQIQSFLPITLPYFL